MGIRRIRAFWNSWSLIYLHLLERTQPWWVPYWRRVQCYPWLIMNIYICCHFLCEKKKRTFAEKCWKFFGILFFKYQIIQYFVLYRCLLMLSVFPEFFKAKINYIKKLNFSSEKRVLLFLDLRVIVLVQLYNIKK